MPCVSFAKPLPTNPKAAPATAAHPRPDAPQGRQLPDLVQRMVYTPRVRGQIPYECGHKARHDGFVADRADGQNLKAEDSSRKWCAEDGGEACADAGHQQHAALPCIHAKGLAQLVGERSTRLDCRALASC